MSFQISNFQKLRQELPDHVNIVAVSKTKPNNDLLDAYNHGIRDFGENYVQELVAKYESLPKEIRWHFIGHLQSNKAKFIVPFVHLIHGVDSLKLLSEIDKQAGKIQRKIDCLLQIHIAKEDTKFGFDESELDQINFHLLPNVNIRGLMGMASFTNDKNMVRAEFKTLKQLFEKLKFKLPDIDVLSMGMSADYMVATEEGSNLVRVGSLLFGER